jgi:hypothetical protein
LFGNLSAKIHLHKKNTALYSKSKDTIDRSRAKSSSKSESDPIRHKSIYYDKKQKTALFGSNKKQIINSRNVQKIMKLLNEKDYNNYKTLDKRLILKDDPISRPYPLWKNIDRSLTKWRQFKFLLNQKRNT